MKKIEVFNFGEHIHFTEEFKKLVREQKRRLREIEILYIDADMGEIKECYRIKLNLEYRRRKYIKMIMKEIQKLGCIHDKTNGQRAKNIIFNALRAREEAFNYYYPRIKIGIIGWKG